MFFPIKCIILLSILLNLTLADDDKYEMYFDKLEMIKGNDILAATNLKIEKTGPTNFVFNGNIEHFQMFNDEWAIVLEIFKSNATDGEYRKLVRYPTKDKKEICTVLKNEYKKFFYESIKECSNAPHFDTCPLKEAKYTFDKCTFDASVFKRFLKKGYYIIKALMSHLDDSDVVVYDLYVHIEEDK